MPIRGSLLILTLISAVVATAVVLPSRNGIQKGRKPIAPKTESYAQFMQRLWDLDTNGTSYQTMTLNIQSQTTSTSKEDMAPLRLFGYVNETFLLSQPTVIAFRRLLDNYNPATQVDEVHTSQERGEINQFLDAICNTRIIQETQKYLHSTGKPYPTISHFRAFLDEVWFSPYPRSQNWSRPIDSSSFEHVFIGETKPKSREVTGLHNWIQAYLKEKKNDLNYTGYVGNLVELSPGRFIFGARYQGFGNYWKNPMSSFFFGSSLEFEMAAYTVCFILQPNKSCTYTIQGKQLRVRNIRFPKSNFISTTYPEV